jgi:plastocyanin
MNVMGISRWPLVAALATVAFVTFGAPPSAPAAEGPQVLMVDNEPDLTRWHFDPAAITVPAGTTVVWFNKGKEDHSVTADDKSFDSGLKPRGASFSRAFPRPGKYKYHCAPHPWMTGTVEVVNAPVPATAAAAASPVTPTTAAPTPTTAAPVPAATTPPAPPPAEAAPSGNGDSTTTSAAPAGEPSGGGNSGNASAAPALHSKGSGAPLAGTLAVVLLPTLGALALGAKLRQSRS